jgi:hypothetical protein
MPAAYVLVHLGHHKTAHATVPLNRHGDGRVRVGFNPARVRFVSVTLANTSTRFHDCGHGSFSCQGTPNAPHPTFAVKVVALRH